MDVTNPNIDLGDSSSSSIDTSNSINSTVSTDSIAGDQGLNTSTYQTNNVNNGYDVEEFDLSEETDDEPGVLESIGNWFVGAANDVGDWVSDTASAVGDWAVDTAVSIYETGAEVVDGVTSWVADRFDDLKGIGANILETAANLASNVASIAGVIGNWAVDTFQAAVSTAAVFLTSVTSGVAKLGEHIVDGFAWCGGKVVEGSTWLLGKLVGLFDQNAGDAVTNWGHQFDQDIKEFIATDWVGKANEWFYEETPVGQYLNEHSAMKYDSEAAKKIMNISERAAEIAAATALTIFTGGLGTFAVGALYGMGKSAEGTYQQNGTDTTLLQELGIAGSGALSGLSWLATGKLGKGFLEIGKTAAEVGVGKVISQISQDILTKDFWMNAFKNGLTGWNGVGNYAASAMMTGEELLPYITGEKEWSAEAVANLGLCYLKNLGLNVAEDAFRDYIGGFSSKTTTDAINQSTVTTETSGAEKLTDGAEDATSTASTSKIEKLEDTGSMPIIKDTDPAEATSAVTASKVEHLEDTGSIRAISDADTGAVTATSASSRLVEGKNSKGRALYTDSETGTTYMKSTNISPTTKGYEHVFKGEEQDGMLKGGHCISTLRDARPNMKFTEDTYTDPNTGIVIGGWYDADKPDLTPHNDCTWFPESWSEDKIAKAVEDVGGTKPIAVKAGKKKPRAIYTGVVDGIEVVVMKDNQGNVVSAYPQNPNKIITIPSGYIDLR